MRNDVGYILQRVERVAPAGDSRPTAGKSQAKEQLRLLGAGHE
jgi:hypothetical protein